MKNLNSAFAACVGMKILSLHKTWNLAQEEVGEIPPSQDETRNYVAILKPGTLTDFKCVKGTVYCEETRNTLPLPEWLEMGK